MYKIKQIPQDFIVEEISDFAYDPDGQNTYILLKKTNYTTQKAIMMVANSLNVPQNRIHYAGTKDKVAVTHQVISTPRLSKDKIESVKIKDIELKFLGYKDFPISLGALDKNRFTITIRNIDDLPLKKDYVPNYFDEQRFGKNLNNHTIGKLIIKRKFKDAVELILNPNQNDKNNDDNTDNLSEDHLTKEIMEHLQKNKNDYIGALKTLPKKIVLFYIHAYQSFLWNETINEILKSKKHQTIKTNYQDLIFPEEDFDNLEVPIIGFEIDSDDKKIMQIIKTIMAREQISEREFIIREIPHLTSEGGKRNIKSDIKNLKISDLINDELNENKKKCTLSFELGKGSYATIVIKSLFAKYP